MKKTILILLLAVLLCLSSFAVDLPEVGKYGMTPIYGRDIEDGTYEISVETNSTFFKVVHATLTVRGEEMTGSITIGSHSYLRVCLDTAEHAEDGQWIEGVTDEDNTTFTFPVEALNKPMACAAFSKRRSRWYDRTILFDAASLPEGAVKIDLPDYDLIEEGLKSLGSETVTEPETASYGASAGDVYTSLEAMEVPYEDGEYSIEVSMTGGTGRAAVSSPTLMIVKDGRAYAKLLWSSSHYDWMIVGNQTYYNANTDGGNSYFIVPISDMDRIIQVVADTTAMGDPVAINYSLTFYADTIGNKGLIPQEAAKKVIILAAGITVVGGIANYFLKKKRRRK